MIVLGHVYQLKAQLSKPVSHDSHWKQEALGNKFLQRKAENDKEGDEQT